MSYTSLSYLLLCAGVFCLYYAVPLSLRRYVLLIGSAVFYLSLNGTVFFLLFLMTVILTYIFGIILEQKRIKIMLWAAVLIVIGPLLIGRFSGYADFLRYRWILPVGISFYSLQIIGYLVDVYRGKYPAERDLFSFALFISWFPQIIQGPIARYDALSSQLNTGHHFDRRRTGLAVKTILGGLFLKMVIADRAGIFVDAVYGDTGAYGGGFLWLAAILYTVQIYADFLSCVTVSIGVSRLFGIELMNNFDHPYTAVSVRDFWRRWHISLSTWLRDYVYIPLGGNQHGKARRYINLLVTFAVSGLWHGAGLKYLVWGLLHGFYQITEDYIHVNSRIFTLFRVMIGWVIFRASRLREALSVLLEMFTRVHLQEFTAQALAETGFDVKEIIVFLVSMLAWAVYSKWNRKAEKLPESVQLCAVIIIIAVIWVFGIYGIGFEAKDFIYGEF